jgi:Protein of unknown function (DUF2442)
MDFEITEAGYVADYKIKLKFMDGSSGTVDLSTYVDKNNVFKAFQDMSYFKKFRVEYGTIVWGNGELDIAPETLYEKATGRKVRYPVQEQKIT